MCHFLQTCGDVVEDVLDGGEVGLAALHEDAEVGEVPASVLPRRSGHGDRVVSSSRLEHSGEKKSLKKWRNPNQFARHELKFGQ